MKKNAVIGAVIFFILAIAAFLLLPTNPPDSNVPSPAPLETKINACDLFTPEDAQTILGPGVDKTESPEDSTIGKVIVTRCAYSSPTGSVSVLIRKASSNGDAKRVFEDSNRAFKGELITPTVSEQEYWVANLSQYNILKGDIWIIATADKDKNKAQKAALIVAEKL